MSSFSVGRSRSLAVAGAGSEREEGLVDPSSELKSRERSRRRQSEGR